MKAQNIAHNLSAHGVNVRFLGNGERLLDGYSSLSSYKDDTFTWARDVETLQKMPNKRYACIIGPYAIQEYVSGDALILVDIDPKKAFFETLKTFFGDKKKTGISSVAVVEEGAIIGKNVYIGPHAYISSEAVIGDDCYICANVVIQGRVTIGAEGYICPGAVIGAEGFAFETHKDSINHFGHYGGVRLGKSVYVGANCCICRGAIDDTQISDYVKLNSLCHIAHNVVIGPRTIVSAGTILMGSVHVGSDCWVSTSTVRDQVTIGNRVQVGMGSVVTKDVPDDITVLGVPAKPHVKNNYKNDINTRK